MTVQDFYLSDLKMIYIPDNVLSLRGDQFTRISELEFINVSDGNREYHSENNCLIETQSETLIFGCKNSIIPEYVLTIGAYSFRHCTDLSEILIPASVESISSEAFVGCSGLRSIQVHPENKAYFSSGNCLIKKCDKRIILGCKNSKIPKSYKISEIGTNSFSGCTGLEIIKVPENIKKIGADAFYKCSELKEINISYNIRMICHGAFYGCSSLTSIIYDGTVEEWCEIKKGKYWDALTGEYTVYCNDGKINKKI